MRSTMENFSCFSDDHNGVGDSTDVHVCVSTVNERNDQDNATVISEVFSSEIIDGQSSCKQNYLGVEMLELFDVVVNGKSGSSAAKNLASRFCCVQGMLAKRGLHDEGPRVWMPSVGQLSITTDDTLRTPRAAILYSYHDSIIGAHRCACRLM